MISVYLGERSVSPKLMPFECTIKPTNAAIATRQCLISAWRYLTRCRATATMSGRIHRRCVGCDDC